MFDINEFRTLLAEQFKIASKENSKEIKEIFSEMSKELSQLVQDMKKEIDEAIRNFELQIRYNQFEDELQMMVELLETSSTSEKKARGEQATQGYTQQTPNGGYQLNLR